MRKCSGTVMWFVKAFVGGVLALLLASFVSVFYCNTGTHLTSKTGATDYVWQSGRFVGTMTEGMAWKKVDDNGYLSNVVTSDDVDILLAGSSHMEARMLFDGETVAGLLNEKLPLRTYNIGTSGHTLLTCINNMDAALKEFAPSKYLILETASTNFTEDDIRAAIDGTKPDIPSYDSGILYTLQQIPYVKLAYEQLKQFSAGGGTAELIETASENAYEALASYIAETCEKYGVKAILFYHPKLMIDRVGTATAEVDEISLERLKSACEKNDIVFVDMTWAFLRDYNTAYVLPNGFCNTSVGFGHLNKYGHSAIAEELTGVIGEMEVGQ